MSVALSGEPLTIGDVVSVGREGTKVELADGVAARMAPARRIVEEAVARGDVVYGITTGFGALANVRIEPAAVQELQRAIVRSHAAGTGEDMPAEVVRGMMLLRARTLAAGHAGVRPRLVEQIVELLNRGILPVVPAHGSVGASGDLAPLAHCALALDRRGNVRINGARAAASDALRDAGLEPLTLEAKEGLALVNGTEGMLAMACLAVNDLERTLKTADVACAMSVEALLATDRPFAEDIHALRPHPGQLASAREPTAADRRLEGDRVAPDDRARGPGRVLAAVRAAGARRLPGRARVRALRRRARARERGRQPGRPARVGRGRERRQLPRRAARVRARHDRDRRERGGVDQRAPNRPHARPRALERAAGVPRAGGRA